MSKMSLILSIVLLIFLGCSNEIQACDIDEIFPNLLRDEITEAAKYYFSQNKRFDGSGFNLIDEDDFFLPTELFRVQYGEDASTARFVAAILGFEFFNQDSEVTFSDVTQFIIVGEYPDARKAFAAFTYKEVCIFVELHETLDEDTLANVIRGYFRSLYDNVGQDRFASLLNLQLGSSLSFVMDTTGSMGGEIRAVQDTVISIIQDTNGTTSEPLNYVLAPYNDPGYGPLTKTEDAGEFIDAVNALVANGGGDFPELAMSGILLAAHNSAFRSIIYVFTDATAKDTWFENQGIAVALTKKISIYIFVTDNIDLSLYNNVVEKTGGAIIRVNKADIVAASAVMKSTTVQGLVTLMQSKSSETTIEVNVDPTLDSLLVLITGSFSYNGHDGPNGTEVVEADISGTRLFRIEDITSGVHRFLFNSNAESTVLIRGKSTLGFHTTLSQQDPETDEFVSSRQMFAGRNTRAKFTIYGDADNANFTTFQLLSRSGAVVMEEEITMESPTRYSLDNVFRLPDDLMVVRLLGQYQGWPIQRVDPCAITPTGQADVTLDDISDQEVEAGSEIMVTTKLRNNGTVFDTYYFSISDNKNYVSVTPGVFTGPSYQTFSLAGGSEDDITVYIQVPAGTLAGTLSKVVMSVKALSGSQLTFSTFVVSVKDSVVRCPSLITPVGGTITCSPDTRSVGSVCTMECGSEYELNGNDKVTCDNGTWSPENLGVCTYLGSQTCILAGDPHYTTFDQVRYDFMGSCLYELVTTNPDSGVEPVTIQNENGLFYGINTVSFYKQAFITVYNTTILVKQNQNVLINGVQITLPRIMYNGDLQILYDGGDVLIKTLFKLEVRVRGHFFRISLPASYRNKVSGMCGNYDGDMSNELQIGNDTYAPSAFGNALEIPGGSNPWCRKGEEGDDDPGCNEAQRAIFAERCAAMKSDCFADCQNETVDGLIQDCVYDVCKFDGSEELLEENIGSFAKACQDAGLQICDWRKEFGFPYPPCGQNQHYEFRGNRCPNTCANPTAADRCVRKPKVEGCLCNDGFLLDGDQCIRASECGCATDGAYYQNGYSALNQACTEQCTCNGGVYSCSPFSCDEGTECRISQNQQRYGCEPATQEQFQAAGDPHYLTLDGSWFDFMGTCKYIALTTKGFTFDDSDREITVYMQNEHRGGNTAVSYVRSVEVFLPRVNVTIGPGTEFEIDGEFTTTSANVYKLDDGIAELEDIGSEVRVKTKFGVTVRFSGTNLYIGVPSYYMYRVSGFSGNFTGIADDDFGGRTIEEFAAAYRVPDGCDKDDDLEEFVCSEEDKAKWAGEDFCGKLNSTDGPFQYCHEKVKPDSYLENCIFDACATDGEAIDSNFEAYADRCGAMVPCDWKTLAGTAPKCPSNSQFLCASVCKDSCRRPTGSKTCHSAEEIARCVCDPGYVLNDDGECAQQSTCGCVLEDGTYVEPGYTKTSRNCESVLSCIDGSTVVTEGGCDADSACLEIKEGEFACVPNEYAYTLVYGGKHFKTFDGKYFDFDGNCAYHIAGYMSDSMESPSFSVFINKAESMNGKSYIKEIIVEVMMGYMKTIIRVDNTKAVMVNGLRRAIGSRGDMLTISQKRGNVALEFAFGLNVHFNGKDWIRIDVDPKYIGKMMGMGGDYNTNPDDDFDIDSEKWGDSWISDYYSSEMCSNVTTRMEKPCSARSRFERNCDCGAISDPEGPFAACHDKMEPEPFMKSCVTDACDSDGSPGAIFNVMKAYSIACLGKGVEIPNLSVLAGIEPMCPENSYFSNCTSECQPSCADRDPFCSTKTCEEGCVCDDGYILSNGKCVQEEKCGCVTTEGKYVEHGVCETNENCTNECTCVYGEWLCEEIGCNMMQECMVKDGVRKCYWMDPCKYDNGGCSDMCNVENYSNPICSCRTGRVLTSDGHTCVDLSPVYFEGDDYDGKCGVEFNIWKREFLAWQTVYIPQWKKELREYKDYVENSVISSDLDVCHYEWTRWYDRDDPKGCGDDESLEMLRVDNPEICQNPIAVETGMADGSKLCVSNVTFSVDETGLVCKNADQERGMTCPDFAVRFLCRMPMKND